MNITPFHRDLKERKRKSDEEVSGSYAYPAALRNRPVLRQLCTAGGNRVYDDGKGRVYVSDLQIRESLIAQIGPDLAPEENEEVIDAAGMEILPGCIIGLIVGVLVTLATPAPEKAVTDLFDKAKAGQE